MQRIACASKPLKVQSIKVSNMTVPIRQRMTMQIFDVIARCCVCDTFEYKSLYFSEVLFGFGFSRPIMSACRLGVLYWQTICCIYDIFIYLYQN